MIHRQIVSKDTDRIVQLAYDAFAKGYIDDSEENVVAAIHNYVMFEIGRSTFAEVCEEDGRILGFITGYVFGMDVPFSKSDYPFCSGGSGQFEMACDAIDECNIRMSSSSGIESDCEATLIVIDPSVRGKGMGTKLFDDIIAHFRENGCRSMCLFTGDNCTMSYYERKGKYVLAGREMLDIGFRIRDSRMYVRKIRW